MVSARRMTYFFCGRRGFLLVPTTYDLGPSRTFKADFLHRYHRGKHGKGLSYVLYKECSFEVLPVERAIGTTLSSEWDVLYKTTPLDQTAYPGFGD